MSKNTNTNERNNPNLYITYFRYFDDDEETPPELAYIPAPGSPSYKKGVSLMLFNYLII